MHEAMHVWGVADAQPVYHEAGRHLRATPRPAEVPYDSQIAQLDGPLCDWPLTGSFSAKPGEPLGQASLRGPLEASAGTGAGAGRINGLG